MPAPTRFATLVTIVLLAMSVESESGAQSVITPGQATGGGVVVPIGFAQEVVVVGFNAQSDDGASTKGRCLVKDPNLEITIRCVDVLTYAQSGPNATFSGTARVNNAYFTGYRIDVNDGGDGNADTFAIVTDSGYALAGTIVDGNIQVHQ